MRADYAEIFQSTENVDKYTDVVYAPGSYASHVNDRQRRFIRGLVTRAFPDRWRGLRCMRQPTARRTLCVARTASAG